MCPKIGDTTAPRDLQEAADYYLTPRGQYPTSTNQMLMTSISTLASFYGFEGAETFHHPAAADGCRQRSGLALA